MIEATWQPVDQRARELITRDGLDRTLFVEAGAGTGKTSALVARIVELVVTDRARMSDLAAITFTEAAASELRDRVRDQFESELFDAEHGDRLDPARAQRCRAALEELDGAALATLHAFAQRILNEHPVLVGIPPRVEVLDEVQSQLESAKRWSRFLDDLYSREDAEELLQRSEALNIKFNDRFGGGPRAVARNFDDNWDRIDELANTELAPLPPIDWSVVDDAVSTFVRICHDCTDPEDKLYEGIQRLFIEPLRRVQASDNDVERLELLRELKMFAEGKITGIKQGRKGNWPDIAFAKDAANDAALTILAFSEHATAEVLGRIAVHVAVFARESAHRRAAEGRLEFHDLLVLARKLLREHPDARAELRSRYALLLLDAFQDTDPIQIEIAVLIASTYDGVATESWDTYAVEQGRLFFVGDPKQSIYRFRRADIGLFLDARERFAPDEPVSLTQNFRTVAPIIEWVNAVFAELLGTEDAEAKDADGKDVGSDDGERSVGYVALTAARQGVESVDHRPTVIGGPHPDEKVRASELRRIEADGVALAIASIRDEPSRWLIEDKARSTRDAPLWEQPKLSDITVLLPTRTSLPFLRRALDEYGIPFRADTGTLLFDQPEVRAIRSVLSAVADPGDQIAVAAALRSPLLACSDEDLLAWHNARGSWNFTVVAPDEMVDSQVGRSMAQLNAWHEQRWWLEPSALIDRILRDRNAFAAAFFDRRPRDAWRRMRYLVEQARAFQESGGGDLRAFLAWVDLQGKDGARAHEPTLEEADDDAVRIMTIHGSKGLEFPITVVSGLTTKQQAGHGRGVQVAWPPGGGIPEIKLSKALSTNGFDRLSELEGQMDLAEKNRLLYVACTRARDHLLVSGVHKPKDLSHARTVWETSDGAELSVPFEPPVVRPGHEPEQLGFPLLDDTPGARESFVRKRRALLRRQAQPTSISATAIARDGDHLAEATDDTDAVEVVDVSDAPVWRRGRAGSAIGRAVHGVLQSVDFATADDLDALARSNAHAHAVPWAAAQIAAAVRQALRAPVVATAVSTNRYWKELFVAVPLSEPPANGGDPTTDPLLLEGYVDLLVETPEGLVIVDYKTDAVSSDADIDAKVARYRLQAAAYAVALSQSTGREIVDAVFVFAQPDRVVERRVADLAEAMDEVRALTTRYPRPE